LIGPSQESSVMSVKLAPSPRSSSVLPVPPCVTAPFSSPQPLGNDSQHALRTGPGAGVGSEVDKGVGVGETEPFV
jgi:hypothetical protein